MVIPCNICLKDFGFKAEVNLSCSHIELCDEDSVLCDWLPIVVETCNSFIK